MTILLTGGTGFIGKNLIWELVQKNFKLILLTREKSILEPKELFSKISIINEGSLFDLKNPHLKEVDLIINLATYFVSNHKTSDIEKIINSNVLLGVKLLEFCKINDCRFINASSFAQNIDGFTGMSQNLYSASKNVFNYLLQYYCWDFGIKAVDLELFDSYGCNDNRNKFYTQALNSFKKNELFKMSPGEQEICLVHVKDITNSFLSVINQIDNLEGYNEFTILESRNILKLRDLALELRNISNSKSEIDMTHYSYRDNEIFKLKSKRTKLPFWSSKITLQQGIRDILKND